MAYSAHAQLPATPQPQPSAGQSTSSTTQDNSADQNSDQASPAPPTEKKPSRIKRALQRGKPQCVHVGAAGTCWDNKSGQKDAQKTESTDGGQSPVPQNQAPPREGVPAGESSSLDNQIDISPPSDDSSHEGADISGVTEMHSYDPHRAMKDVEVGDFYFHKKDYRAAESRYQGALEWKPNDAIATFRLAQSEEKLGKKEEAIKNYQAYLKILPEGDFAKEAKDAIERLSK
jgi:tetratricopeptide (TPR) repeat protein